MGGSTGYQQQNTFYYHTDHLGSTNVVTDYEGNEYQYFEYTPYGESWMEGGHDSLDRITQLFTGKERDSETGYYYFGARYLDAQTSRWLSVDPALGEYVPVAPLSREAKQHNQNLPGEGGVYNSVNLAVYHYGANNPIRFVDPDGRQTVTARSGLLLHEIFVPNFETLAIAVGIGAAWSYAGVKKRYYSSSREI